MARLRGTAIVLLATLIVTACGIAAPPAEVAATPDIRRAKLDIVYTALLEGDVHRVSSRAALSAALDAVRDAVRTVGGDNDVATPDFREESAPASDDFQRFSDALTALAMKNPRLGADRLADAAIAGMIGASPDCHTVYVDASGRAHASRPVRAAGTAARIPSGGTTLLNGSDATGLTAKLLPGGIGYVTFREYLRTGTYDVSTEVRRALDLLLGAGARAWLFDLRGNSGGDPPQTMTSWFLDGQPIMRIETRQGSAGVMTGKRELRLPQRYQLPMAVILNDAGGSSPEVFALGLKENSRATLVGQRSLGCLGATAQINLSDGSLLLVTAQEFIGGVSGARYNNEGIPPDVRADDASAVNVATDLLLTSISQTPH